MNLMNSMSILGDTNHDYISVLCEYSQLARKQDPDDEEEDRLMQIYDRAMSDPLLNFFIMLLDQILGEDLGLLDEDTTKRHEDQQAWLREHLEETVLDKKYRLQIQKLLHDQRLYDGPIDGILGKRSCGAVAQFRKSLQELLQKQGWYNGVIDGELGQQSVVAVREFQRSKRLKEDGVPGPTTFSNLISS